MAIFRWEPAKGASNVAGYEKIGYFRPRFRFISKRCHSCYGMRIENRIKTFELYYLNDLERRRTDISMSRHYIWRWISQKRYEIQTYRDLHIPYSRVSFRMTGVTLSDLAKYSNSTKHRTVPLRQLSFLYIRGVVTTANKIVIMVVSLYSMLHAR